MSPVSLQVSLIVAGLTSILGVFIFIRLAYQFRAIKALQARPELEPLLAEITALKVHLDSLKGREWFVGKFVLRLLQKRMWDASQSPEFRVKLLQKMRELNRLNLSASQIMHELESLTYGEQAAL